MALYWTDPQAGAQHLDVVQPSGWADVRAGVGKGLESAVAGTIANISGDEADRQRAIQAVREQQLFGQRATEEGGLPGSIRDVRSAGDLARFMGRGMLESSPQLALGTIGAMGGPVGMAAALAGGTALTGGQNLAAQMAQGGEVNPWLAYGAAVPEAALNVAGSGALIKGGLSGVAGGVAREMGAGALGRAAAGALTEAGEQAAIGGAQTAISAAGQNRQLTRADLAEGAIAGGVMGVPFGAWHGFRGESIPAEKVPVPDKTKSPFDLMQDQNRAAADRAYQQQPAWMAATGDQPRPPGGTAGGMAEQAQAMQVFNQNAFDKVYEQQNMQPGPRAQVDPWAMTQQAQQAADQRRFAQAQQDAFAQAQARQQEVEGGQAAFWPGRGGGGAAPIEGPRLAQGPALAQMRPELFRPAGEGAPPVPPTGPSAGQMELGLAPGGDWRQNARDALKDEAGHMRQLPLIAKALKADTPDDAAQVLRDRAVGATPDHQRLLDAVHKGITGNSFAEHAVNQGIAAQAAKEAAGRQTRGMVEAAIARQKEDWRGMMRDAWRAEKGNLSGFTAALKDALSADSRSAAEQAIRDKAADTKGSTPYAVLDAVHQKLTGESIADAAKRVQGERNAIEARQESEGYRQQYQRNGQGGAPAEAGGGGVTGERAAIRGETPEAARAAEAAQSGVGRQAPAARQGRAAGQAKEVTGARPRERTGPAAERATAKAAQTPKAAAVRQIGKALAQKRAEKAPPVKSTARAKVEETVAAQREAAPEVKPLTEGQLRKRSEAARKADIANQHEYLERMMQSSVLRPREENVALHIDQIKERLKTREADLQDAQKRAAAHAKNKQSHMAEHYARQVEMHEKGVRELQEDIERAEPYRERGRTLDAAERAEKKGLRDVRVSKEMIDTMRRLTDEKSVAKRKEHFSTLRELAKHDNPKVREAAEAALEKLKNHEPVEEKPPVPPANAEVAPSLEAMRQARDMAPETRPGLRGLVKEWTDKLTHPEVTPEARQDAINALHQIAHLERDLDAVAKAKRALTDHTTYGEQLKAEPVTQAEAANRVNIALGGDLREGVSDKSSEHDREVFAMAGTNRPATEILQHIAENHPDENVRALATALQERGIGEGRTIRLGTEAERAAAPVNAVGEARGREVLLHSTRDAGQTVLHELAHTATVEALNRGGPAAVEMRRLYAEAMRHLSDHYGLKNVKEFVAEAYTNPEFRQALAQIDSPKGNLWQRFWSAVGKLLGLKDASLLDAVMHQGDKLMKESAEPRTMRGDGSPEALYRQVSEGGATGFTHALSDFASNIYKDLGKDTGTKLNLWSMPTHIIVRAYHHLFPALTTLFRGMGDRTARISELQEHAIRVGEAMEAAYKAAGKSLKRFNEVMSQTQAGERVHPKTVDADKVRSQLAELGWIEKSAAPDSLEYLRAKDRAQVLEAQLEARKGWEAMTEPERKAVDLAFEAMKMMHAERGKALNNIFGDEKEFAELSGEYAPLKRYGDWLVSARSKEFIAAEKALAEERAKGEGNEAAINDARERVRLMSRDSSHRWVEAVRNEREAKALTDRLQGNDAMGRDMEFTRFERRDFAKKDTGYRDALITRALNRITEKYGDNPISNDIQHIISEAYLEQLPDGAAAMRTANRQLVSGWSQDFPRAIMDRLNRDAFQIGTLEHGHNIAENLQALEKQTKEAGTQLSSSIYNAMASRNIHDADPNRFTKAEKMVTGTTHAMMLGLKPAFLVMNMLQTPLLSAPLIASRFGFGRSWGTLHGSVRDVWKLMNLKAGHIDLDKATHLSEDERAMLQYMQRRSLVDMDSAHMSAAMARGDRIIDPQTGGQTVLKGLQRANHLANVPVQVVEAVNRASTALAAYRLAMEGKGRGRGARALTHEQAMEYAAEVLRDTHVDYSAGNNPKFFSAPWMRVAMQFKKYGLNMFHMLNRTMVDGFGNKEAIRSLQAQIELAHGANKLELQGHLQELLDRKTEARHMLVGLLGMHQLMVGALGLPFSGAGFAAADILRGWVSPEEQQPDTKADFQNYLANAFGTDVATVVSRGLPGLFGLDMSRRAGMSDIAPFTNTLTNFAKMGAKQNGAQDLYQKEITSILGPAEGIGNFWFKGADQMRAGNYLEGLATMLPKVIQDAHSAYQMAGEKGVQVGGKQVHAPLNGMTAFLQFMGMPTVEVERAKEAGYSAQDAASRARLVHSRMVQRLSDAMTAGEGVPDDVREYNDRNPQLKVTRGDVLKQQAKEARAGVPQPARPGSAQAAYAKIKEERMAYATEE